MNAYTLVAVAFFTGTLLAWLLLQVVSRWRSPVERRLRAHGAGSTTWPKANVEDEPVKERKPPSAAGGPLARIARRRRQQGIEGQIIDALTLISSSLKAGYSFLQAIEMASREVPPPLGEEFERCMHEMSLGATVEDSLQEMSNRVGLSDLDMVFTAVIIQRQVGGNLAEVLDTIAHTIRERIRIRGEIRTLTAQGRISGWIVGSLPLAILGFISVVNPSYMKPLFQHPLGIFFICIGITGQVIGVLLIKKIINIEV